MKTILIFILCLSVQSFAQIKVDGDIILTENQEVSVNKALIAFLESQIDTVTGESKIISWEGKTEFSIPYLQIFRKNLLTRKVKVDNKQYYAQYEITHGVNNYITVFDIKTKYKEFNLKAGKIKKDKSWKNNDDESFVKPDKNKIKEKLKKIKIKQGKLKEISQ